jgi:hypothetical protein
LWHHAGLIAAALCQLTFNVASLPTYLFSGIMATYGVIAILSFYSVIIATPSIIAVLSL